MGELACVNGEIMPINSASIYIEDRGYQLGDGIYEVIASYGGVLFTLQEHLERMKNSAELIRMKMNHSVPELSAICQRVFEASELDEAMVYVQLTRGVSPRQHNIPSTYEPVLVVTVREKPAPPETARVITTEDLRWKLCCVKSTNLLPNVLAREEAADQGCDEAVFIREGKLMEGASTNIFIVKKGRIHTPPADNLILEGITRNTVLQLIDNLNFPVEERYIKAQELFTADEAFLTGTLQEVTPIVEVDGLKINDGRPGSYTERIVEAYQRLVNSL